MAQQEQKDSPRLPSVEGLKKYREWRKDISRKPPSKEILDIISEEEEKPNSDSDIAARPRSPEADL